MDSQTVVTIVIIVIVILVILFALRGSSRNDHDNFHDRGSLDERDFHHNSNIHNNSGCCEDKCCDGGEPCPPPNDVKCRSEELFTVDVKWDAAHCEVDHYKVYVKHLNHCKGKRGEGQEGKGYDENHEVEGRRRGRSKSPSKHKSKSKSRSPSGHGSRCDCDECKRKKRRSRSRSRSRSPHRHGSHCQCDKCKRKRRGRKHDKDCDCDPCRKQRKQKCGKYDHDQVITVPGHKTKITIHAIKVKGVCITVSAVNKCGKESKTCKPCKTCVNCSPKIKACIEDSDCTGLTIKWKKVECAVAFKIFYDDQLMFELPGDATGASGLPPIEETHPFGCPPHSPCSPPVVSVQVFSPCGKSRRTHIKRRCHDHKNKDSKKHGDKGGHGGKDSRKRHSAQNQRFVARTPTRYNRRTR